MKKEMWSGFTVCNIYFKTIKISFLSQLINPFGGPTLTPKHSFLQNWYSIANGQSVSYWVFMFSS